MQESVEKQDALDTLPCPTTKIDTLLFALWVRCKANTARQRMRLSNTQLANVLAHTLFFMPAPSLNKWMAVSFAGLLLVFK